MSGVAASAGLAPAADLVRESVQAGRERKRHLDTVVLAATTAAFALTAALWFLRLLDIDIAGPARLAFGYGALYLVAAAATDRLEEARALARASQVLQLTLIPFLAAFWHWTGGIANPMFLLAFFLPVAASGATLSRRQPYWTAAFAALSVVLLASAESSALRWYLGRMGIPIETVGAALAELLPPRPSPFPQIETEPAFLAVLLAFLVAFLFIGAAIAQILTGLILRLASRLRASVDHLAEVTSLFEAILRAEPAPGLVVYADTGQVVQASDSFLARMLLRPEDLVGKTVFDLIHFAQPERLRALLESGSGEAPFLVYKVGPEVRIANLNVHSVVHAATGYAYIGFKDLTESYYLHAAFDAIPDPLLVVGRDGRLRYANRAAEDLFGALHFNMEVERFLIPPGSAPDWWRTQPVDAHRLELSGRPWRANILDAPLPDASGGATIITLRNIAREEELVRQASVDPLTGAYNRRYLEGALLQLLARVAGGGKASLVLIDLDDLRAINDQHGHAAGDAAVRHFVGTVRSELRSHQLLARTGDDEFAIVFPDLELAEVSILVDRIYGRLERLPLAIEGKAARLRFSAGAVALKADDSIDSVTRRADRLLQAAKKAGKGRCLAQL